MRTPTASSAGAVSPRAIDSRTAAAPARSASTTAGPPKRDSSARTGARRRSSSIDGMLRKSGIGKVLCYWLPSRQSMSSDPPKHRPLERFWPYAELPEQPSDEELASLDPDLHEALFGARPRPFSITLVFPDLDVPEFPKALELAR